VSTDVTEEHIASIFKKADAPAFTLGSCSAYFLDPEDRGGLPPKRPLTLNRLLSPWFLVEIFPTLKMDAIYSSDRRLTVNRLLSRWFLVELIFSTLKMEAIYLSETSVGSQQTAFKVVFCSAYFFEP
jgi:hypothetical protein